MKFVKAILPLFFAGAMIALLMPAAGAVFLQGETVTIDTPLNENVTVAAQHVDVKAQIKGDLTILAAEVVISENVYGTITLAVGDAKIENSEAKNLRVISGNIDLINSKILGEISGVAGQFLMDDKSKVDGDAVFAAGSAILNGSTKNLQVVAGTVELAGNANGNITILTDDMQIKQGYKVQGDLKYTSQKESAIPANTISGKTEFTKYDERFLPKLNIPDSKSPAFMLFSLCSAVLIGLFFILLFPGFLNTHLGYMKSKPIESFSSGVAALVLTPIFGVVLIGSIFGIPLALMLTIAYMLLICITPVLLSFFYGSLILSQKYVQEEQLTRGQLFMCCFLGVLAMLLIGLVPVIGMFVNMSIGVLVIGGVLQNEERYLGIIRK